MVKGRVVDDSTGAPLPLTDVFISNSTIGAAANSNGNFVIRGVPIGSQQIAASIVGYKPASVILNLINSTTQEVEFRLKASPVELQAIEVQAKDPVEWKQNLERFVKAFIGSSANSPGCKLLNPQVLDFSYDEESKKLIASVREPLEIENRSLGYRIRCVLVLFIAAGEGLKFLALNSFRPLAPKNPDESAQWAANRRTAYFGSRRHFLISLINHRLKEEGFEIFSVRQDWDFAALRKPTGFEVDVEGILGAGDTPFERKLGSEDLLQIVYTRGKVKQVSIIELHRPYQVIFTNGFPANPLGITTSGYWSTQRAAELLPIDYVPE